MKPESFKDLVPILIYGPRKSGTTLLQNLHDTQNQILSCPSELKLKQLINAKWTGITQNDLQLYCENNKVIEVPNFNLSKYKNDLLVDHVDVSGGLKDLIVNDMYCLYTNIKPDFRPKNLTHWAVKEVGGNTNEIIQKWKLMYPNGKIIMLIRNPLMVASSILRERRKRGLIQPASKLMKQIESGFLILEKQLNYVNDPSFHFLKYENLIDDTVTEMKKICQFLQIEFDEDLTKTTIFGELVVSSTASQMTKSVFKTHNRWYDKLTLKEKFWVLVVLGKLKLKHIRSKSNLRYTKSFYSQLRF
jgi:hypothetical protein